MAQADRGETRPWCERGKPEVPRPLNALRGYPDLALRCDGLRDGGSRGHKGVPIHEDEGRAVLRSRLEMASKATPNRRIMHTIADFGPVGLVLLHF